MTVKTVLCRGSLGRDPVVLLGAPDTSLSSQAPSYSLSHHVPSPGLAWSLQSLREALHPSHRPALVLPKMWFSSSRALTPLLVLMGRGEDNRVPGVPVWGCFPMALRREEGSTNIAPCLSFPSGSTQSPYPPRTLCSPAPSPLPDSLRARSSKGFHPVAHPHHPVTALFQETQALQGGAQPDLPGGAVAAAAGGQLAPVPPGHQPGRALPTLQPHHHQAPPGHAGLHHYQCR